MQNEMRDRLVKDLRISKTEWLEKECDHETDKELVEYVADYLIADSWVRPPYKIGSMVWVIDSETSNDKNFYIFIDTITHYRIVDGCTIMCLDKHLGVANWNWDKVFLTKDQAEQKLKEMRGEDNV